MSSFSEDVSIPVVDELVERRARDRDVLGVLTISEDSVVCMCLESAGSVQVILQPLDKVVVKGIIPDDLKHKGVCEGLKASVFRKNYGPEILWLDFFNNKEISLIKLSRFAGTRVELTVIEVNCRFK